MPYPEGCPGAGGGRFGDGFLSGFAGSTAGAISGGNPIIAAILGGAISDIGGGKFASGAKSGFFHALIGPWLKKSLSGEDPRKVSTGGREVDVVKIKDRLRQVSRVVASEPDELSVNYDPRQIAKIYGGLVKLADVQGMDFHTDILFGPEREMLLRVALGHGDSYTVAWFRHEIAEVMRINQVAPGSGGETYRLAQLEAHKYVNHHQGHASPLTRYHPSIVNAPEYAEQFR